MDIMRAEQPVVIRTGGISGGSWKEVAKTSLIFQQLGVLLEIVPRPRLNIVRHAALIAN